MRHLVVVPVLAVLAACTPPVPLDTATGFPEVIVKVPAAKARDFIASELLPYGWTVKTSNEYQLTVGFLETGQAASLLAGTRLAPNPEQRRTYTFTATDDVTKITARAWLVSNPGTAFEKLTPFGPGSVVNGDIQRALERVKVILER